MASSSSSSLFVSKPKLFQRYFRNNGEANCLDKGDPHLRELWGTYRTNTEKVVTSSYFMLLEQNRGLKLTKSRVWYNLVTK